MADYEELLAELNNTAIEQETLAKSHSAKRKREEEEEEAEEEEEDDEKIRSASEDGDDDEDDREYEEEKREGKMTKSISALIDGQEVEAIDATEVIKSLTGRLDAQESALAKVLSSTLGIIKSQGVMIKEQGQMIKSLNSKLAKLSNEGAGRKAVVTVHEPSVVAKSQADDGWTPQKVLAKANDAWKQGKISGLELNMVDVAVRNGDSIPQAILAKAFS